MKNKFTKESIQTVLTSNIRDNEILQAYEYFILHYNELPNYVNLRNLSIKAFDYFADWDTLQRSTALAYDRKNNKKIRGAKRPKNYITKSVRRFGGIGTSHWDVSEVFAFVKDDFFANVERSDIKADSYAVTISYLEKDREKVEAIADTLLEFSLDIEEKVKFAILVKEFGDACLKEFEIKLPQNLDLALNYGKDFIAANDMILNYLESHTKGLYLYHGDPGTGKSTYIKYLASKFPDYKFIYIPEMLVTNINSPEFLSLLLGSNKKQVIVIEDSEKFIRDRNKSDANIVSTILNISDGILSDIINVPIIMTYNMKDESIDEALLRKGRLKFSYEFKALPVEDAQRLADHLKLGTKITEPTTIADLYNFANANQIEKELKKKKAKPVAIGFGAIEEKE